jgi:hypothetical protein
MSPRPRFASVSVASAAAIGLIAAISVAPSATADPCTGAAANIQPPPGAAAEPTQTLPWPFNHLPIGRKPAGANESAPLPSLGALPAAIIGAFAPHAASVHQQAAVIPAPSPPGTGNQHPPTATQQGPVAAAAQPAAVAPAPAPAEAPGTSVVGWVTGLDSQENTLQRFGISGADLGIMWDNGDPANHQVLMAFGDTYGYCGARGQQWRYNTLFRTQDRRLSHGINVADGSVSDRYSGSPEWQPGFAKQIIPSIRWAPTETGIIPTAGISVGSTQYVNFMSINKWDSPGQWTTNYSAIAVSSDNGQNWGVYPGTIRTPAPNDVARVPYAAGNENFQQGAFLRAGDGYVYSFGTPPGRGGSAYVARVPQGFVPDLTKYQYWNSDNGTWVPNNPAAATPVIPGPVGEMSAQYNTYLKQFLVLYCNNSGDIVSRTAPAPQGPWGPEQMIVSSDQMPGGAYAPFLHPWSTGKDLYFNLSLWSAYNVMLMHTVLP